MDEASWKCALADIRSAMAQRSLAGMLAWHDVVGKYRRSRFGVMWITLTMAMTIFPVGYVFSQVYRRPPREFLPFLTVGMILWSFMSSVVNDACLCFLGNQRLIGQFRLPAYLHVLRVLIKNLLILAHHLVWLPLVWWLGGIAPTRAVLFVVPGFLLMLLNLGWVALVLGLACLRFRDVVELVRSSIQLVFFVTPILWTPSALATGRHAWLVVLNPVHHVLEGVRAPLLAEAPPLAGVGAGCALAVLGWSIGLTLLGRYRDRIPYWL